jgi:hypothetical protein
VVRLFVVVGKQVPDELIAFLEANCKLACVTGPFDDVFLGLRNGIELFILKTGHARGRQVFQQRQASFSLKERIKSREVVATIMMG